MPITSITIQPNANSINAAYRPVVVRTVAKATDNTARPPVVYCDIYFNDIFYKTISKSQYSKLNALDSEWQFDIQDAGQEYLKKFLARNGEQAIVEGKLIVTKTLCKLRSSGIDGNGFILPEGTVPVQGTGSSDPEPGTGTSTHNFYIVNATLQHEDNQDLEAHLNTFKLRTWGPTTWPLSHRPDHYKICTTDSDSFGILHGGLNLLSCIALNYRFFGQTSYRRKQNCALVPCPSCEGLSYMVVSLGDGTQNFTFNWNALGVAVSQVDVQHRASGTTGAWISGLGSPISPRVINLPLGLYDFRFITIGTCVSQTSPELDSIGVPAAGCAAVGIIGTPVLPDATVGTPYSYSFNLSGTPPFALASVVKPAWMNIIITGGTVFFSGTPGSGDAAGGVAVSFDITNCASDHVPFADTIDVDPALTCIPVGVIGGAPVFPDATAGFMYSFDVFLSGTAPFAIVSATKPAWMNVVLVGNQLHFSGVPDESEVGVGIVVSVTVSNCAAANTTVITDTISVISSGSGLIYAKVGPLAETVCTNPIVPLYSSSAAVTTGVTIYDDSILTTPHTGDSYIVDVAVGEIFHIDPTTGVVGISTGVSC